MKISLLLPDFRGGGTQKMMINLAEALARRGHDISLIVVQNEGPLRALLSGQCRVHILGASRMFFSIPKLGRFLRLEKPGALISAMYYVNFIAVLSRWLWRMEKKTCLVISERSHFTAFSHTLPFLAKTLNVALIRWLYPRANFVIGISEGVSRDIAELGRLEQQKVQTIYNPVITPDFESKFESKSADSWIAQAEGPLVITSGRLDHAKDYPTLIQAFAMFRSNEPKASLIILGDGELKESLENEVSALDLSSAVRFMGFVSNPLSIIRHCDIFAISSRYEGFCNVIVEALYCELPVVATDCPSGPAEILEGGKYGELVPVGDVKAFARALHKSWAERDRDPGRRQRAMAFTDNKIAMAYEKTIEQNTF